MGTDIQMVAEKRGDGGWIGAHAFQRLIPAVASSPWNWAAARNSGRPLATARNYPLFAALAQVRSPNGLGLAPRGIPPDASPLTRLVLQDWADGYGHSWLGVPEAVPLFVAHAAGLSDYHGLSDRDRVVDYAKVLLGSDDDFEQWRLVFWFDD